MRPVRVADAEVIFSLYATDTEVTRYLTWKPHSSVAETREFLGICEKAWSQGTSCPWAIERREDGQLLGPVAAPQQPAQLEGVHALDPRVHEDEIGDAGIEVGQRRLASRGEVHPEADRLQHLLAQPEVLLLGVNEQDRLHPRVLPR